MADPNNTKLGATYYARMKVLFKQADPCTRKFVVQNPAEVVSPALLAAMQETQKYHRNVAPLLTQLQIMPKCNQKELIGILKFNDSLAPSVSQMQWSTSLSIATYCSKHDLAAEFPDELEAARPMWDKARIVRTWATPSTKSD